MTARWIGDVATETGLSPLDVARLLALQGMYPYSGYLEDQHVMMLRAKRAEPKGRDVLATQTKKVVPLPPLEEEKSAITSPIPSMPKDGSEEKTMILPPMNSGS
ncbi:MAG: hypothetical protein IT186_02845 [Acidobacteria bacterium]|nr:hypothetical protein [Acidobacteriota bacterium]MCG3192669.1 hypothetical protein [Thermoanaerobaculia bacterium]MCK6684411.1 hypothetical protein [Thermoanaerobaculia bacterium]